ncbi:Uncharacterized protein PBTT_03978 [Plasmodiophora brassicae]|uniref:Uncharacterized protein n=1 Tax=Plasmodiophora brassicae TaxID=37360 RepID=A0A0G4J5B1_PLABS|nr:hypothetical protein PBRA_009065 [Plasmodiophora brassicae]SPQ96970.1 unnamed protein product [Plasmodiophora brassicae]
MIRFLVFAWSVAVAVCTWAALAVLAWVADVLCDVAYLFLKVAFGDERADAWTAAVSEALVDRREDARARVEVRAGLTTTTSAPDMFVAIGHQLVERAFQGIVHFPPFVLLKETAKACATKARKPLDRCLVVGKFARDRLMDWHPVAHWTTSSSPAALVKYAVDKCAPAMAMLFDDAVADACKVRIMRLIGVTDRSAKAAAEEQQKHQPVANKRKRTTKNGKRGKCKGVSRKLPKMAKAVHV